MVDSLWPLAVDLHYADTSSRHKMAAVWFVLVLSMHVTELIFDSVRL